MELDIVKLNRGLAVTLGVVLAVGAAIPALADDDNEPPRVVIQTENGEVTWNGGPDQGEPLESLSEQQRATIEAVQARGIGGESGAFIMFNEAGDVVIRPMEGQELNWTAEGEDGEDQTFVVKSVD